MTTTAITPPQKGWALWNPMNPASPLRSKRVQGAATLALGIASAIVPGLGLPGWVGAILANQDQIVMAAGTLWALVGTITASSSPRNF